MTSPDGTAGLTRNRSGDAYVRLVTTAFVLSGGACLGAVQVGMLQALREAGITPDLIVGTSVGAVNGGWIAGGVAARRAQRDFGHADELITRSYAGAREWLAQPHDHGDQAALLCAHHHS